MGIYSITPQSYIKSKASVAKKLMKSHYTSWKFIYDLHYSLQNINNNIDFPTLEIFNLEYNFQTYLGMVFGYVT